MIKLSEKNKKCPFCHIETQGKRLLHQTQNYHVLCDQDPLAEGHLLIIPKKHLTCFGEIPKQEGKELERLLRNIKDFLTASYKKPVLLFENGGVSQTVVHAHLHIFPSHISIKNDLLKDFAGRASVEVINMQAIREFFKRAGFYLYYGEQNKGWIFEGSGIVPGFLRAKCAQKLKVVLTSFERIELREPFAAKVKQKWQQWRKAC